jgi:hypothetical protein
VNPPRAAALALAFALAGCHREAPEQFTEAWKKAAQAHEDRALFARLDDATQTRLKAAAERNLAKAKSDPAFAFIFASLLSSGDEPVAPEAAAEVTRATADDLAVKLLHPAAASCYPSGWDLTFGASAPDGDGLSITGNVTGPAPAPNSSARVVRASDGNWRVPAETVAYLDEGNAVYALAIHLPFCARAKPNDSPMAALAAEGPSSWTKDASIDLMVGMMTLYDPMVGPLAKAGLGISGSPTVNFSPGGPINVSYPVFDQKTLNTTAVHVGPFHPGPLP